MAKELETGCCPRFNPAPWDDKEITWNNKLFVKDHVTSLFHIPLNFGRVISKMMKKIKAVDDIDKDTVVLSDENSMLGSDLYVSVKKEIPNAVNTTISGTFLTKVFEGPYKDMSRWIKEMKDFVASKDKVIKKLYFYYTTCPKCAKAYGKNHVVIFAKV
ncbi:hypothetical protein COV93_01335 [Candidatus Woesearchaeota archaeon CG11_big_fil_rev_8_21_14_0_20_43_8]|nr:MAG: hypothetical protein COV93_01335 [Candidatus Woesearchaeota archaeon CG11_big_fil_rev_8_21_14_0_20_43_8]PIO04614.1 MAG: hypothetical protein COT47_08250 [Candidatus Woesearchaeota archaeon CG08_land_8_20_14_0_20_43_7]